ncbi:MAG: PDDEXK nuclease domain-containing protein [Planctomycetota bacterium]
MKKIPVGKKALTPAKRKADDFAPLIAEVRHLIRSARRAAASTVNTLQVLANFEIGRCIVEYEQKGERRAEYGELLMRTLAARLTEEFGRGFSKSNLEYMRRFYLAYQDRGEIAQSVTGQSQRNAIGQKLTDQSQIAQLPTGQLAKLTHQDLGQMQMYVNDYDRHVKLPEENPTIGLLPCKEKKDAVVKLTLPVDADIHAGEYQLYLPSKGLLKKKLIE